MVGSRLIPYKQLVFVPGKKIITLLSIRLEITVMFCFLFYYYDYYYYSFFSIAIVASTFTSSSLWITLLELLNSRIQQA